MTPPPPRKGNSHNTKTKRNRNCSDSNSPLPPPPSRPYYCLHLLNPDSECLYECASESFDSVADEYNRLSVWGGNILYFSTYQVSPDGLTVTSAKVLNIKSSVFKTVETPFLGLLDEGDYPIEMPYHQMWEEEGT